MLRTRHPVLGDTLEKAQNGSLQVQWRERFGAGFIGTVFLKVVGMAG